MAEYIPLSSPESDDDDDDEKDSSTTKSKKSTSLGRAAGIGAVLKDSEQAVNKEVPKPAEVTGFDRLLAHLSLEKATQEHKETPESEDDDDDEDETASNEAAESSTATETIQAEASQERTAEQPDEASPLIEAVPAPPEPSEAEPTEYIEGIPGEIALPTAAEHDEVLAESELEEVNTEDAPETTEIDSAEAVPDEPEDIDEPEVATPSPIATLPTSTPASSSAGGSGRSSGTPPGSGGSSAGGAMPTNPHFWGGQPPYTPNTPPPNNVNQVAQPQTVVETVPVPVPVAIERPSGFWTGALLAGGIEHIRHRRREKKMAKAHKATLKKHEEIAETNRWNRIRDDETAKVREAFAAKYKAPEAPPIIEKTIEHAPVTTVVGTAQTRLESLRTEKVKQEVLEVPTEHHVERSAWLSTEVDKHGKAVENPNFAYGKEYHQERARERAPVDSVAASAIKGAVASGGTTQASDPGTAETPYRRGYSTQTDDLEPTSIVDKTPLQHVTQPPTTPFATAMWGLVLLVLITIIAIIMF